MNARLVAVALFAPFCSLRAQDGPPTFVPKEGALVRLVVEDVPTLLARHDTRLGRLLAEPEVAEALATFRARIRERQERNDAVLGAAAALGIDQHQQLESLFMPKLDLHDFQRFEAVAIASEAGGVPIPSTVVLFGCTPKAEGRLTQAFEALARTLAADKTLAAVADAKLGGFPIQRFGPSKEQDEQERGPYPPRDQWLAHLPGVFVLAQGEPDELGSVAPAPARAAAHAALTIDAKAYLAMIRGFGGMALLPFTAFDGVDRFEWRGRFEGDRLLDELELTLGDPAQGALTALLTGTAKLPAQPLPEGAMVQARCAIDVKALLDAANDVANVRPEVQSALLAAFTGGAALAAVAPAPGAMLPRLYLSLGIADDAALTRALELLLANRADASKKVTYDGVECTVVALPGAPPGLQPVFCRIDGVLHVAESGTSMRALLKALKNGGEAMDVGEAPLPAGPGEPLATFDLRCDEAAMYRAFHAVWLPLFALVPATELGMVPVLERDEMPDPDVVCKHLGKSRGVLRKDGNKFTLQHLGALGGPEAAALAMAWGPIVSGWAHDEGPSDHLVNQIAQRKITMVWEALDQAARAKEPWPATLGELIVAAKLPDDALLIPGDALAEDVVMPAGDPRKVKSSFRYFPSPLQLDVQGEASQVLFVAIAPRRYGRVALAPDGTSVDLWGEHSTRRIDTFK